MDKLIQEILVKFFANSANLEELELLTDWLKEDGNAEFFKKYAKLNYAIDVNLKEFNTENAKKELLEKIKRDKRVFFLNNTFLKYAAIVMVFVGIGYLFKDTILNKSIKPTVTINHSIQIGTDKATLTLEDGAQIALEKGSEYSSSSVKSNGEEIIYEPKEAKTTKIEYNYLTIPSGGQYYVKLSDGTQVWLNSESKLKYPVAFVENETRQVELVYGEAFFDVSPSANHKGSKFKVLSHSQEIEVLGTEFNVSAYKDDENIKTTLVEGKVLVTSEVAKTILKPGQQAILSANKNLVVNYVNVYNTISWKQGVFSFDEMSLKKIMKVLSRWYDVEVVFENENVENEIFTGTLRKNQNIEDILKIINLTNTVAYEIKDNIVIIK